MCHAALDRRLDDDDDEAAVPLFAEVADKCRWLDCPSSATRRLIGTARSLLLSFTRPLSPPYDNRRAAPPLDRSHTTKTPLDDAVSTPPPPATQTIRPPRHAYVPGRAIGAQRDEASGRGEKEHKSRDEPPARRLRPPAPHLSPPPPAALGRSPNARPIGPWGTCPARSSRLAATRVVLATAPVPRRSRSLLASQATARFSSTFHIVRCRRTSRARSLDFCANYQSSASIPRPSSCLLPRSELSPFVVLRCHSLSSSSAPSKSSPAATVSLPPRRSLHSLFVGFLEQPRFVSLSFARCRLHIATNPTPTTPQSLEQPWCAISLKTKLDALTRSSCLQLESSSPSN